jgi:hypothetical protein
MKTKKVAKLPFYDRVVNRSISLPRRWYVLGCGRQRMLEYESLSEYIEHLIEKDVSTVDQSIPLPGLPEELEKERPGRKKTKAARR